MNYKGIRLSEELKIDEIFSIHYFEYMSDFYFPGETHNFWEFLCVDKGEVNVFADERFYSLKRGEIIFHKPNEFHNVKSNGLVAPNLVVMSFSTSSPAIHFFEERVLQISEDEQILLSQIIKEARRTFDGRLDNPYQEMLIRSDTPRFGGEQLIKIYLEQFLIQIIRRYVKSPQVPSPPANFPVIKSTKRRADRELFSSVLSYMEAHIRENLTIEQICRENSIGRSQLQKLFRERDNAGVIGHFSHMKIDLAKQMIRENNYNFTQISDSLGFSSIHYFSRQFKKITGMTPSEYASSIKSLAEPPQ